MGWSNHYALDMLKIGDAPFIVNLHAPDGTLVATIYGANNAQLIMSLLNRHRKEALDPEEDK